MIQFVSSKRPEKPLCLVLGNLDGIHLGHQFLLNKAHELAQDGTCEPALMRLDPHPRVFFHWGNKRELIQNEEQTLDLLHFYGVDHLLSFPFNETTSRFSPDQFVDFMLENLAVNHLVIGSNFRFGHQRSGDPEILRELTRDRGIEVHECSHVKDEQGVISSTRIRACLKEGDVQEAARMLGRPYFLEGPVGHGLKIGREMGIPTANMEPHDLLLPRSGVYATWIRADGTWYPSISNIGVRPTHGPRELGIETHVLETHLDLYQKHVFLAFMSFMRPEKAFPSFEDLKKQIESDIATRKAMDDYHRQPDFSLFDLMAKTRNGNVDQDTLKPDSQDNSPKS